LDGRVCQLRLEIFGSGTLLQQFAVNGERLFENAVLA
jgi:hypothetical protein